MTESGSNAWPPHITVATVVVKSDQEGDQFLFVEERDNNRTCFNQPAGHLEPNETLMAAALRETREETAWKVELTGFIGLYHYYSDHNDTTYLRVCFSAAPVKRLDVALDSDIIASHWLSLSEIRQKPLRSPLVLQCLEDSIEKPILPLNTVKHLV